MSVLFLLSNSTDLQYIYIYIYIKSTVKVTSVGTNDLFVTWPCCLLMSGRQQTSSGESERWECSTATEGYSTKQTTERAEDIESKKMDVLCYLTI